MGVMRYLNQYQLPLHKNIMRYTSLHILSVMYLTFSTETLGHVIFPPQGQRSWCHGTRKRICLVSVISRLTNDHRQISNFSSKIGWMGSQLLNYLRIKSIALTEPQSVSLKPSVPCAETSWSVLVFSVSVTYTTFKQTLNCLIEYLEEEELRVKFPNSISIYLTPF